jgi:hypothetical protein
MPNIFMKDRPVAKEKSVTVSNAAALVTIRPTWPSPSTVASTVFAPRWRDP